MIGLLVNGLSKAVGGYFEHSAKKAKAKSDLKIAEIEAKTAVKKKIAEGKVEWENTMADATKDSWKDEYKRASASWGSSEAYTRQQRYAPRY